MRDSLRRSSYLNAVDTEFWWLQSICRVIMMLNTRPHGLGLIICREWTSKICTFGSRGLTRRTARVSISGTLAAEWDKKTWFPLLDLALNHPESGIHLQGPQNFAKTFYARWTADNIKNVRSIAEPKIRVPPLQTGLLSCCLQIPGSRTLSPM